MQRTKVRNINTVSRLTGRNSRTWLTFNFRNWNYKKHNKIIMRINRNCHSKRCFFKPSIWSLYDQDAANLDILQTESCGFEPWDIDRRYSDSPTKASLTIGWKPKRYTRKLDKQGKEYKYELMKIKNTESKSSICRYVCSIQQKETVFICGELACLIC